MMLTARLRKVFPTFELDVNLHLRAGVTALFGPSGSGKTSIIRALAGLLRCDLAQIDLDGRNLGALPVHKRNIGCVFQDARLFPHLNVRDNLRFAGTAGEADVIDLLGLAALLDRHPSTLSGGEAQRIKLARELARRDTGRTLYILDEPTTGLHFQDIRMLLDVLNRLVETGNTVIVIEHNLDVIKTADWIIDLGPEGGHAGGRVVAQGSPEKVANKKSSYTGRFLREILDG